MVFIVKQYYLDPWLQEFNTKVISQESDGDLYKVILAETIFYPTGGGQPHDLGSISGVQVLDVFEQNEKVIHVLKEPLPSNEAVCLLDWSRRFDHMQQHSGQHLLSAILDDKYNYQTESFHLGEDYCSIDISTPRLTKDERNTVEAKVNEVILANLQIITYTLKADELNSYPLRKIPDLAGDLRIVEIDKLDYSPCSGTHLQSTGQIGILKITKCEKYKGMTRVYFLCGERAFHDYARKQDICQNLSSLLSVPEEELLDRLTLDLERRQELEKNNLELRNELLSIKAQNITSQDTSPFFLELPGTSIEEAQQLARFVLEFGHAIVVVSVGERVVLMHNQASDLHLGQLIKEYALPLGGKGGGSATNAQVFFTDPVALNDFIDCLKLNFLQ